MAIALIGPLAWEPPCTAEAALEKAKRKNQEKKKKKKEEESGSFGLIRSCYKNADVIHLLGSFQRKERVGQAAPEAASRG